MKTPKRKMSRNWRQAYFRNGEFFPSGPFCREAPSHPSHISSHMLNRSRFYIAPILPILAESLMYSKNENPASFLCKEASSYLSTPGFPEVTKRDDDPRANGVKDEGRYGARAPPAGRGFGRRSRRLPLGVPSQEQPREQADEQHPARIILMMIGRNPLAFELLLPVHVPERAVGTTLITARTAQCQAVSFSLTRRNNQGDTSKHECADGAVQW